MVVGIPTWLLTRAGTDTQIEPYVGPGSAGAVRGPATTVRGIVEDTRRLVRDANGDEVVSSTTIRYPLGTVCPAQSRVTVNGRTAIVLASGRQDGRHLPVPSHLEVSLQ